MRLVYVTLSRFYIYVHISLRYPGWGVANGNLSDNIDTKLPVTSVSIYTELCIHVLSII